MADGEVDLDALRVEHKETLDKLAETSAKLKELKEASVKGEELDRNTDLVIELKAALPLELLNDKDKKKRLKKIAAEAKKAELEAKKKEKQQNQKQSEEKTSKRKKNKNPDTAGVVFVNKTPVGEKKDMNGEMSAAYNPPEVEAAWDAWWEQSGFYTADRNEAAKANDEDKFVIVIPPPNVTGSLHIGHALTCSIQDALCRWHRMTGKHVLWVPGTDHAGIATQAVVEKKIMRENNQTRHDLGREKFLEKVWEWKEANGAHILTQLRILGASVDHSRTVFTMDEERSKCVTEAFVQMYEDGLIYRDTRLVNWSHALSTALSDIEVDHIDLPGRTMRKVKNHDPNKEYEFGTLTSFAYKIAADDESGPAEGDEEIVVATTRLETMLGDTAVAVHPEDPRYAHLHGKKVWHPFRNCAIPIITDDVLVDMAFGTAAVKITPAHDPNDFACGRRHNLEEISILNDDGSINGVCGAPFEGLMRYDARVVVEEQLKTAGLFRDKQSHAMQIPVCSRSGDVIEPRLKPQWWVNCKSMAAEAVEKVRSKELKLIPESAENTWFYWLENIQDWCVSRQLWWGHRIPAYKAIVSSEAGGNAGGDDKWFVGRDEDEVRSRAAKELGVDPSAIKLEQDPDVLDTWYSSGLFPFSTVGWCQEGEDAAKELEAFFPGSLLETGHDILFFWVARMVMMSLQLQKKLPFREVFLHPMVRDKFGRKMSKSLGNVVSPEQVIDGITLEAMNAALEANTNLPTDEVEKAKEGQYASYPDGIPQCGADALRFGLLHYTGSSGSRDLNLDINLVAAHRRFCNKIWQATKFCMMNLGDNFEPEADFLARAARRELPLALRDRWILSALSHACTEANKGMASFDFTKVTDVVHSFFYDNLCDVYVEALKPVMRAAEKEGASEEEIQARQLARNVLWWALDVSMRLMHPLMPFVTEELWQRLPGRPAGAKPSIMVAHYPAADIFAKHKDDPAAEAETKALRELVDEEADIGFNAVLPLTATMRSIAADFKVQQNKNLVYFLKASSAATHELLNKALDDIIVLSKAKEVNVLPLEGAELPLGSAGRVHDAELQVFLELKGVVDPNKELEKLEKNREKLMQQYEVVKKRVDSEHFSKMAPEAQEKDTATIASFESQFKGLDEQKEMFEKMAADFEKSN
mmetsp:Transcript_21936/g.43109  ORF Transcript_21936/g.43109 Transcript_21936/m.43109 type:complete len:1152 (+) Transcript_21936:185-3640(+)|eukprot:CAMPEP_0171493746 /NCGR_PEP_ID=MMETSP0958-20121227/5133_1 /TAXON_ID=87120 /ORGANISM="Aurantiochytrium limacinum, Strain ATCCMYA-1381" /LENGTH=1151 /DNA_ID=CAMNT_0012027403 /DNA_START=67 /DNA_END=3522 /DNA_ORIENTATION=+